MNQIIDRILKAEREGELLKKRTAEEAEINLENVRKNCIQFMEDTIAIANKKSAQLIKNAERDSLAESEKKIEEAKANTVRISDTAKNDMERAAEFVVERLLGEA